MIKNNSDNSSNYLNLQNQILAMNKFAMQQRESAYATAKSVLLTIPNFPTIPNMSYINKVTRQLPKSISSMANLVNAATAIKPSFPFENSIANFVSKNVRKLNKINKYYGSLENVIPKKYLNAYSGVKKNDNLAGAAVFATALNAKISNMPDLSQFEALLRAYSTKNKHINLQLKSIYKTPDIDSLIPAFTNKKFQLQIIKNLDLSSEVSPDFSKLFSNFENISSSKVFNDPSQENNVKENGQNSVNKNEQRSTKNAVKDTGNNRYNSYSNEQDKHSISPLILIIFLIYSLSIGTLISGKIENNNDQIFISDVLAKVADTLVFANEFTKND